MSGFPFTAGDRVTHDLMATGEYVTITAVAAAKFVGVRSSREDAPWRYAEELFAKSVDTGTWRAVQP